MNVLIVGFGTAGRYYFKLLEKDKKIKEIYIIESRKLPYNKKYFQINFSYFKKNKINIDAAMICTPSNLHYYYAKACLDKNINVLIEKPFVLKLSHAKKLINITMKKKLKCWTTLQNRYNLAVKKLVNTIRKNELGKIVLVDCTLFWHRSKKYYKTSWRGKYISDGGVLNNQAIHLLDMLIYIFGSIKYFDVYAGYNKKKLEAEDLILINFIHKNNIASSFKATTRANRDYRSALDVIGEKGRSLVKGISLNTYQMFKGSKSIVASKHSENFPLGLGPRSGMGTGHKKILKEFLNNKVKKSSCNLEISKNVHVLKVIHSIYNALSKKKKLNIVKNKQSLLGAK